MEAYARLLADLFGRSALGIKLGLEVMRESLAALGRPDRSFRSIVVGGTNGKGTTASLIAKTLALGGARVGLYTSPHLLRFSERLRVLDGSAVEEASRAEVIAAYEALRAVEAGLSRPPTFFECATAMGLWHFARRGVQIAVLEVGLGGRLDATNVVDKELAVLTPIDIDHTQYLGSTLAAIAGEKADILPPGGVGVVAPQAPGAEAVLRAVAAERHTRLRAASPWELRGATLHISAAYPRPLSLAHWPAGGYQPTNVATAATACAELEARGFGAGPEAFARAAASLRWLGRYQWLAHAGLPLLLDGAHNLHGIRALVDSLTRDPQRQTRPIHAIAAVLSDKAVEPMFAALRPACASLHLCAVGSRRSRSHAENARLAQQFGADAWPDFRAALERATAAAQSDGGMLLVTGSLFLVADALVALTGEPRDPPVDG